jgi:hypothetical protein
MLVSLKTVFRIARFCQLQWLYLIDLKSLPGTNTPAYLTFLKKNTATLIPVKTHCYKTLEVVIY